jgi:hypothetical protein
MRDDILLAIADYLNLCLIPHDFVRFDSGLICEFVTYEYASVVCITRLTKKPKKFGKSGRRIPYKPGVVTIMIRIDSYVRGGIVVIVVDMALRDNQHRLYSVRRVQFDLDDPDMLRKIYECCITSGRI